MAIHADGMQKGPTNPAANALAIVNGRLSKTYEDTKATPTLPIAKAMDTRAHIPHKCFSRSVKGGSRLPPVTKFSSRAVRVFIFIFNLNSINKMEWVFIFHSTPAFYWIFISTATYHLPISFYTQTNSFRSKDQSKPFLFCR
jgi:hypothetical protein